MSSEFLWGREGKEGDMIFVQLLAPTNTYLTGYLLTFQNVSMTEGGGDGGPLMLQRCNCGQHKSENALSYKPGMGS